MDQLVQNVQLFTAEWEENVFAKARENESNEKLYSGAEANAGSLSSQYSSTGSLYSALSSKYNLWGSVIALSVCLCSGTGVFQFLSGLV